MIFAWGMMKLRDGGTEQVEIIGYNPNSGIGAPWRMKRGDIRDVKGGRYIIVDESAEKRLGRMEIGDEREIMDKEVKVIGIAEGMRSITMAPFVLHPSILQGILHPISAGIILPICLLRSPQDIGMRRW